ncbi:acyltransferase family protein [Parvularcula sp. ZS-1/3]|uniref:Acyltransferase family protein n=1 Tax=Parvularcula mediterranea TaxID=2732508 RepID=A0A7Y3RIN3_9PROT|nr:acyltransferase family protein [Parvularcula mediterranea]NNU14794.1 acyltransferase family protein [Parvularcula mediterranea]
MKEYRADIDGLRAIAVLLVVAAHVDLALLKGGFVGVDVFFVISGFLITRLLISEHRETGRVDFRTFYWRRLRRLTPAVVAATFLTLLGGFLLLSQDAYSELVGSAISAVLSVSNVFFWINVDYFDTGALTKPLLHTWSLGVEEQFYLFWPLMVVLSLRWIRKPLAAIASFALLSFALNWVFFETDWIVSITPATGWLSQARDAEASAFYLFPFRVFEFAIGGFIAAAGTGSIIRLGRYAASVISLIGLGVIFGASVLFDADTIFPYANALVPALGTAALIVGGSVANPVAGILSSSALRFIGRISYSVYLVHWPLVVFWKLATGPELSSIEQAMLAGAAIVCGYGLYLSVEKPFRYAGFLTGPVVDRQAFLQRATLPAAVLLVVVMAFGTSQISRIPTSRLVLSDEVLRQYESSFCGAAIEGFPQELFTCQVDRQAEQTLIVWGDSHARHLVAGLSTAFPRANIAVAYLTGCMPQSGLSDFVWEYSRADKSEACVERNRAFIQWAENEAPRGNPVLVTNAKRLTPRSMAELTEPILDQLAASGLKPFFLEDFIRPEAELGRCRSVPSFILSDEQLSEVCQPRLQAVEKELAYNEELRQLIARYLPVHDAQCAGRVCSFVTSEGYLTHRDTHHLSPAGSAHFLTRLVASEEWQSRLVGPFDLVANSQNTLVDYSAMSDQQMVVVDGEMICPALSPTSPAVTYNQPTVLGPENVGEYESGAVAQDEGNFDQWTLTVRGDAAELRGQYRRGGVVKPIELTGSVAGNRLLLTGRRGPRECTYEGLLLG